MENAVENNNSSLIRCIITTGVSSLHYYNNYMQQFDKDNEALYNCMGISSINSIDKAELYNIIIDLSDNNIKTIVFEVFNHLLPLCSIIYVKLIKDDSLANQDAYECTELLKRLHKNQLIKLEVINKITQIPKGDIQSPWLKKIKNLFFFIGPGNTGKTSIITAITELCNENEKSVGLVDLTEDCKLMNYFPNVHSLENIKASEQYIKNKLNNRHKGSVDVYRCPSRLFIGNKELLSFEKTLNEFKDCYDYVFINADVNILNTCSDLFWMGEGIFIVHDIIPTKINITKYILLTFAETGISLNSNITMIYNKIIRSSINLKNIEEKLIFKKTNNHKLIPLVDLSGKSFEIPYNKKTMGAFINSISTKSSIIHNVSYSYKRNIEYIYKHINNEDYVELEDMNVTEYIEYSFRSIIQCFHIENSYKIIEKYISNLSNFVQSKSKINFARIIEKH